MNEVHQLENEIIANCVACNAERVLAYWDEELESYIYLCDEEPLCNECMSKQEQVSSEVISKPAANEVASPA